MRPLHSRRKRSSLSDAQRFAREGIGGGMGSEDYLSDSERREIVEQVRDGLLQVTRNHFPRTSNLEYAILKAHLIVEFEVTQFIRCSSHILVAPESLKFTFSEKLEIAVLLGLGDGCPTTVPSIELLNRIRNQVAHRFDVDVTLVDQLIRINSEDPEVSGLTDRQRISCLRRFCYCICAEMAGYLKAVVLLTSRQERAT